MGGQGIDDLFRQKDSWEPPKDIQVFLMEGTRVNRKNPSCSEDDLEEQFIKVFERTHGRVFITSGALNIGRIVTLFINLF
jgi:mRNA degradation ribonuclease J1/J2